MNRFKIFFRAYGLNSYSKTLTQQERDAEYVAHALHEDFEERPWCYSSFDEMGSSHSKAYIEPIIEFLEENSIEYSIIRYNGWHVREMPLDTLNVSSFSVNGTGFDLMIEDDEVATLVRLKFDLSTNSSWLVA
jgi:hypothetical protein